MIQLWINVLGSLASLCGAWYATARFTGSYLVATIVVAAFVAAMALVNPTIQARRWAEYDAEVFGVDSSLEDGEAD